MFHHCSDTSVIIGGDKGRDFLCLSLVGRYDGYRRSCIVWVQAARLYVKDGGVIRFVIDVVYTDTSESVIKADAGATYSRSSVESGVGDCEVSATSALGPWCFSKYPLLANFDLSLLVCEWVIRIAFSFLFFLFGYLCTCFNFGAS